MLCVCTIMIFILFRSHFVTVNRLLISVSHCKSKSYIGTFSLMGLNHNKIY